MWATGDGGQVAGYAGEFDDGATTDHGQATARIRVQGGEPKTQRPPAIDPARCGEPAAEAGGLFNRDVLLPNEAASAHPSIGKFGKLGAPLSSGLAQTCCAGRAWHLPVRYGKDGAYANQCLGWTVAVEQPSNRRHDRGADVSWRADAG